MKPLSKRAAGMPAYQIREIMELAWKTPDCIHLEVGQPNFSTPDYIGEAGIQAIRDGFTMYTSSRGIPALQEAICEKLRRKNGIEADSSNITVCPGAVTALESSVMAIAEEGDEVLIPDPAWHNPKPMVDFLGAVPVPYILHPETGFLPDVREMEKLINSRTKAIVINTPSNPTGAVFPRAVLEDIYALARKYDLYIISDEVYEDFVFDCAHFSIKSIDTDGRVVAIYGLSKSHAMTGWRLGYAIAPPEISAVISKLQELLVSCASSISQKAAVAALLGPNDPVEKMRDAYKIRRDIALDILRRYGLYEYTPNGAFYLMVNVSRLGNDSGEIAKRLLRETKVAVAPGTAFGKSMVQYVRISLAASEEDIREGMERLCRAVTGR
ncbi:MAG: pyridoxal phosphate-dependent aminotransferase [Negativicutes bacterium]|nr:pyridoxal phosphate-dependent aminotransferase [Negativicutes bacterium]MDR3714138.1 pyridoxal phosphate-dependent aminotransferase [Puia sp.]